MAEAQMPKRKRRRLRTGRVIMLALLLAGLVLVAGATGVVLAAVRDMPDWNPALIGGAMTTTVYDRDNQPVASLHGPENRFPVPLSRIPKHMQEAVIATEDNRFLEHHGVDFRAIARAALVNLRSASIEQGGSTITQQLAKNAFIEKPEKTLKRKVQEAIMALQLERLYSKQEILEFYLNEIYFGHGAYGVQAAARTYFNKNVEDLNLAEAAMLAGLIKSPGTYSPLKEGNLPKAKERQAQVLDNMVRFGYIDAAEAEKAKQTELQFTRGELERSGYRFPYYLDYVIEQAEELLAANGFEEKMLFTGGLKIYTALDTRIQEKMEAVYANPANFPKSPDQIPVQSAMVVLDPHDGGVRALIGGREHQVRRGWNRATQARRQPGSAIKPIAVYAPALEEAGYSPATVVDDVPVSFPGYTPRNYDNRYRGLVNLREALRWSINVVAVKVLHDIGVERGYNFARDLGLPVTPRSKHLSLALGAAEASPLEMAAAYAAFANGGIWIEPHAITRIADRFDRTLVEVKPHKKVVMSEQTAFLITDMLQTVVKEGTGTRAQLGRPAAGKTGTTQLPDTPQFKGKDGTRDAWFIGYTPELVGAVWMGYDQTDAKHYLRYVAGGTYPAAIWKQVMAEALKGKPVVNFPRPEGIVYVPVDVKSGLLPSELTPGQFIVTEVFAKERVPTKVSDVWVQAQVCAETKKLATPACPSVVTGVFLKRPVPYEGPVAPEDAYLEVPTASCPLHGSDGQAVEVSICTDPRHQGIPYLANVPQPDQQGGCPPALVQKRRFAPGEAPTASCPLPDHQIITPTGPPAKPLTWQPQVTAKVVASGEGDHGYLVKLHWQVPADRALLFAVERSEPGHPKRANLGVVTGSEFLDTQVEPGKAYTYRVVAIDRDQNINVAAKPVTVQIPP
ncbi:MAG: penicillin-binding protein 1A [Clostridia bacterium]|nr:penicillin-binding protein 1A [Clostridia bacterium]